MWRLTIVGMLAGISTLALTTRADEPPSAEYVQAMKTLEAVSNELPRRLSAEDAEGLNALVIRARPALATLEQYWAARKIDEAVDIAQRASKAIAEISVAVHLMTDGPNPIAVEGAQASIQSLQASCTACHAAYRRTLPDGSFAIK